MIPAGTGCRRVTVFLHRGTHPVFFFHCPEFCLILVPVFHQIHLVFGKRGKLYLKFHCLFHIFTQAKHKHDLVTGHDTKLSHAGLSIQFSQLVQPFFI